MGSRKRHKPAAFHTAMSVKSLKKKQGMVRGSRAAQNVKTRRDTLLVEYKNLRKANTFKDNRLEGSIHEASSHEAKALLRFQAQRVKGKRDSKFDLSDLGTNSRTGHEFGNAGAGGTHMGDLVDQDEHIPAKGQKKSKREAMREVIAKSKMHRHNKAREAEEVFESQAKLDNQFQELLDRNIFGGSISLNTQELADSTANDPPNDVYDKLTKDLAKEKATVYASERTVTQEEAEVKKQEVFEKALNEKKKRMMTFSDEEDDYGANERLKSQKFGEGLTRRVGCLTRDAEDSDLDLDTLLKVSALDQRRQMRASGDDLLQVRFRKLTDALLDKYTCVGDGDDQSDDEDTESGSIDSGNLVPVEENSVESVADTLSGDANEQGSDEHSSHSGLEVGSLLADMCSYQDNLQDLASSDKDLHIDGSIGETMGLADSDLARNMFSSDAEDGDGLSDKSDQYADIADYQPSQNELQNFSSNHSNKLVSLLRPSYPIPKDYEEFLGWVLGHSPENVVRIISLIRVSNHKELNAAVKMRLEELMSFVWEYFGALASNRKIALEQLNALIAPLCDMARDVPLHAGSLARKELKKMQGDLLQDLQGTNLQPGWPTSKSIVFMQLIALIFPVSDRFHPVTSPLAVLVCQYLAQCSVSKGIHIAKGLFLTSFATKIAMPALRYSFEPLAFISMTLRNCVTGAAQDLLLCKECRKVANPFTVEKLLQNHKSSKYYRSEEFKAEASKLALACLREQVQLHKHSISFPEVFLQIVPTLEQFEGHGSPVKEVQSEVGILLKTIKKNIQSTSRSRKPLVQKFRLATPEVKQYNPRMDEIRSRSSDPSTKEMKKKLNVQRRGAMKELRKDAVFMARVRESEKSKVDKERMESERRFYKELNTFEQDWKSGGQGGMNPHLKKKKMLLK